MNYCGGRRGRQTYVDLLNRVHQGLQKKKRLINIREEAFLKHDKIINFFKFEGENFLRKATQPQMEFFRWLKGLQTYVDFLNCVVSLIFRRVLGPNLKGI